MPNALFCTHFVVDLQTPENQQLRLLYLKHVVLRSKTYGFGA
jgi:hypothetical protein